MTDNNESNTTEKEGFVKLRVRRGFTEVAPLYDLCQKHNAVICGGYARYCASGLPNNRVVPAGDADLFPREDADVVAMQKSLEDMGFELRYENHVSVTMKPSKEKKEDLMGIPTPQIIKPVKEGRIMTVGAVEDILVNFDFTIVRAALISPTEVLVDPQFENDERNKILRLKNIHCPVSSLLRCMKYARKGYFLRPAQALKLFIDCDERDDEYRSDLIKMFQKSAKGKKDANNPDGMTQEEIDELEGLLRID